MCRSETAPARLPLHMLIRMTCQDALRLGLRAPLESLILVLSIVALSCFATPSEEEGGSVGLLVGLLLLLIGCLYMTRLHQLLLHFQGQFMKRAAKLFLAVVLFGFLISMAGAIFVLFFTMVGASIGIASTSQDPGSLQDIVSPMQQNGTFWLLFSLFLCGFGLILWFSSRLSLFAVTTIARGQIHIFRSWSWTRPQQIKILAGYFILVVLPVLFCLILSIYLEPLAVLTRAQLTVLGALSVLPVLWLYTAFTVNLYGGLNRQPDKAMILSDDKAAISDPE